ncbi:PMZ-type zinc finger domain-containing protein [Bacillus sp. CGMCC 1.16541]|uniref:PMZ-type zinc finger domain-containing protein n=1 Tax=Bacillus sp. CGMCC 1.16541 TaxID=2185143 RepID=UPI000D72FFB9|nr:PMZ-type zinc finger domain-containing protein [Bacillus sp. CGMCC 1.16541]
MKEQFFQLFSYDDVTTRKAALTGLQLYRSGQVTVKDALERTFVENEQVHFHEQYLQNCTCSCGKPFPCEHIFAACFHHYASQHDIMAFIRAWKEQTKPLLSLSALKPSSQSKISNSFAHWNEEFQQQYEAFIEQHSTVDFTIYEKLYRHYHHKVKKQAPTSSPLRELYIIYGGVYLFLKVGELIATQDITSQRLDSFVRPYVYSLLEEVDLHLSHLHEQDLSPYEETLLLSSMSHVRTLLHPSTVLQNEKLELYQMLWSNLFAKPEWIQREQQHTKGDSLEQTVAQAHLFFLQQKDVKAITCIKSQPLVTFLHAMKWATSVVMSGEKKRAQKWMTYIEKQMSAYIRSIPSYQGSRNMVAMILTVAESYDEHSYVRALRQLLPYSFIEYSRFLYERAELKQWIELQTSFQYNMIEYEKDVLAVIKRENLRWLLPIYHQSIHHLIEQRNRKSYEEAVHVLCELKELYVSLNEQQEYDIFLKKLTASTKSLRAFQQALQKGKLIHV